MVEKRNEGAWWCPIPKIKDEEITRFISDPEVVTLEVLFLLFTVLYVFIMWGIMQWVWQAPAFVTWSQLLTGFVMSWVFGEAGRDFPSSAFFPPIQLSREVMMPLMLPVLAYLAMTISTNCIFMAIPSIAYYPTIAAFAVATHHATRFFGCGQVYMPIRWLSNVLIVGGFLTAVASPGTGGPKMLAFGGLFAVFSSAYRGCFLEKAMHVVQGNGNILHNNQNIIGLLLLPFISAAMMEHRVILAAPSNFNLLFTWQYWGCLVSAGTLPFIKNIIANRLIRVTGQGPWRILELLSIVIVFIGGSFIDKATPAGVIASFLMIGGRLLGSLDALSIEPLQVRQKDERDEEIQRQLLEYAEVEDGDQSDEIELSKSLQASKTASFSRSSTKLTAE